jgi:hypothetical protein
MGDKSHLSWQCQIYKTQATQLIIRTAAMYYLLLEATHLNNFGN